MKYRRQVIFQKIVSPEGKIISEARSVTVTHNSQEKIQQISTSSNSSNSASGCTKSSSRSFLKKVLQI